MNTSRTQQSLPLYRQFYQQKSNAASERANLIVFGDLPEISQRSSVQKLPNKISSVKNLPTSTASQNSYAIMSNRSIAKSHNLPSVKTPIKLKILAPSSQLYEAIYQSWFSKRYQKQSPLKYHQSQFKIKSDQNIDLMFSKLDTDGGGTLSMEEITDLFVTNGIQMEKKQIANMLATAQRKVQLQRYQKCEKSGGLSSCKVPYTDLLPKSTETNLKMNLNQGQFKVLAQQPPAIKIVKSQLKKIKRELQIKHNNYDFVPLTMEELMIKFKETIYRNKELARFRQATQRLADPGDDNINQNIQTSMSALNQLLKQPVISTERFPNQENNLYLKLLAKVSREHSLEFVRTSDDYLKLNN